MNPKEKDFQAKKEVINSDSIRVPTINASRQWSSYKNPRIVRVSRTFGGKDRHSKVCTVKGLRDRRIRLSVPTAILLYDLQDKLGLSQPSKVVDWLIDVTKHEIDKLPPLPLIATSGNFTIPFHPMLGFNQAKEAGMMMKNDNGLLRESYGEKDKWIPIHNQDQNKEALGGFVAQNFFPVNNPSSFPNFSNNLFHNWDPSNLSLSQFGGGYCFSNTNQNPQSLNNLSTNSYLPIHHHNPISFPPYMSNTPSLMDDLRQLNHPQVPTTLHLMSLKDIQPQESNSAPMSNKDTRYS